MYYVSEVVSLVAAILPIVALFQVFDGVSAVTAGILRAMGKQACCELRQWIPSNPWVVLSSQVHS
jgi:Na+-driven multidrug efflux pump